MTFLGSLDVVSLLLDCGSNVDSLNSIGKTAANLAAFTGLFRLWFILEFTIVYFIFDVFYFNERRFIIRKILSFNTV